MVYYVDQYGDDTAAGDQAHPWRTTDKVTAMMGQFPAGSTICFTGGQIFGKLVVTQDGLRFTSAGGTGPKASFVSAENTLTAQNLRAIALSHLAVVSTVPFAPDVGYGALLYNPDGTVWESVEISDCEFTGNFVGLYVGGSAQTRRDACKLTRIEGHGCGVVCFKFQNWLGGWCRDFKCHDNHGVPATAYADSCEGIDAGGTDMEISFGELWNNGFTGEFVGGNLGSGLCFSGSENCKAHHIRARGLSAAANQVGTQDGGAVVCFDSCRGCEAWDCEGTDNEADDYVLTDMAAGADETYDCIIRDSWSINSQRNPRWGEGAIWVQDGANARYQILRMHVILGPGTPPGRRAFAANLYPGSGTAIRDCDFTVDPGAGKSGPKTFTAGQKRKRGVRNTIQSATNECYQAWLGAGVVSATDPTFFVRNRWEGQQRWNVNGQDMISPAEWQAVMGPNA